MNHHARGIDHRAERAARVRRERGLRQGLDHASRGLAVAGTIACADLCTQLAGAVAQRADYRVAAVAQFHGAHGFTLTQNFNRRNHAVIGHAWKS